MTAVVELMHGKNAFKKIGTDDLFNKEFMLDAFSIKEAKRLQMKIDNHFIIFDKESVFSLKNNSWIKK